MYVYQNHLKYYNTINVLPGILNTVCDSKIILLQKCIKNVYRRRSDEEI